MADEAGLLRYVSLLNTSFSTDSVYQLQYGTELVYQSSEPVEIPHMINRPWTAFEFIPHKARTILFHQSGSNKLLYTTLPDATAASSPVLLFGSHTGHCLPMLCQTQTVHYQPCENCIGGTDQIVHTVAVRHSQQRALQVLSAHSVPPYQLSSIPWGPAA